MREAFGRAPLDREVAILQDVLTSNRSSFEERPQEAAKLLAVGDAPRAAEHEDVELAAWTQVARVILNLHEVTTRE